MIAPILPSPLSKNFAVCHAAGMQRIAFAAARAKR